MKYLKLSSVPLFARSNARVKNLLYHDLNKVDYNISVPNFKIFLVKGYLGDLQIIQLIPLNLLLIIFI